MFLRRRSHSPTGEPMMEAPYSTFRAPSPTMYGQPMQAPTQYSSSFRRSRSPAPSLDDPQYKEKIGRASWVVLHAVTEQFPENPTPQEQQAAITFIRSFADMYPCLSCRPSFQQLVHTFPPDVSSKQAFIHWMECFHDQVNMKLNKPALNECGWPQALPSQNQFDLNAQSYNSSVYNPAAYRPEYYCQPQQQYAEYAPQHAFSPSFQPIQGSYSNGIPVTVSFVPVQSTSPISTSPVNFSPYIATAQPTRRFSYSGQGQYM